MDSNIEKARLWYKNACEYLVLGEIERTHPLAPMIHRGMKIIPLAPKTVRLALICEMLMKAILTYEGVRFRRLHKLDELYAKLSDEAKGFVVRSLENAPGEWDKKLEDSLAVCANCFVDLRYRADKGASSYKSYWPLLRLLSYILDEYAFNMLYEDGESSRDVCMLPDNSTE